MTKYIGYLPAQEIVQYAGSRWDYVNTGNPAIDTNPQSVGATWLNMTTGEEFVCIDNTDGFNHWVGSNETEVGKYATEEVVRLLFDTGLTDTSAYSRSSSVTSSAVLSSAQSVSGGNSLLVDATGYVGVTDVSDLAINTGDFTIEAWLYPTNITGNKNVIAKYGPSAATSPYAIYSVGSSLELYLSSNGTSWDVASAVVIGTLTINTWCHVAVVRDGSSFRTYFNGVAGGTVTSSATLLRNTELLTIGGKESGSGDFEGHIDLFRILQGLAIYNLPFTPPTEF